jgi:hypothetical protein
VQSSKKERLFNLKNLIESYKENIKKKRYKEIRERKYRPSISKEKVKRLREREREREREKECESVREGEREG